jgi:hypothetical protein
MTRKNLIIATTALLLALAFSLPSPSHASGASDALAEWEGIYSYWEFGDTADAPLAFRTDASGNTAVGDVVMMPLPNTPGDGTAGSVDVTLNTAESFFLPLWVLLGTSYTDGTPSDRFFSVNVFKTLNISFKIDGVPLVTNSNVMDNYAKYEFDPEIPIDFPPIDTVIWIQGISVLHSPLSAGKHTMTLDVKNTIPAFGSVFEYHNTWNIRVVKAK